MMRAPQRQVGGKTRIGEVLLALIGSAVCASALASEASQSDRVAQLPRYSASGIHRCESKDGEKRSCVVTGLFSTCSDAALSLQTRDCCPTTKGGGASSGFTLTYCIPDVSGR